ncbi:MAG: sn-glycerol-1-phosphate dehydrogenase [Clostridia bacterium]|nr:sn-glycerol-1-phosphate dehydrogenase [Clostridia bacterium]
MNINEILHGTECCCGKQHYCDIEYVYIESGAVERLTEICQDDVNILIVADENTFNAAGEQVQTALDGKISGKVIFDGKRILIPDENAIAEVNANIDGVDLIVGIGSGVIQDLCKYVSHFSKIPYIIVATAPSMDGYASTGAAMILKGMKETVSAGLPRAIVADTDILKNSPMDMIKAGYGDIIGKFSALNDWRLSHVVNGEYFCQYIYDVTYKMIENTLDTAKGLLNRDEQSIKTLMEALVIVGIMMSFAGSSRPASGSEHHLSHFFEIVGIINGEPYFPHGIDVAYSTVVTAQIREKLLKEPFPDAQFRMDRGEYETKMSDIYKSVAHECIALQDKVGAYNKDRTDIYKAKEQEIRKILSEMPTAEEIENMLKLAEIHMTEFYDLYSKEKLESAIAYAKDLKDRYTVLWMNYNFCGGR